jgi:hypothetical protein
MRRLVHNISYEKHILVNQIVKYGLEQPFYPIDVKLLFKNDIMNASVSMSIIGGMPIHSKGLYAIYASNDNQTDCVYVGESHFCTNSRVRKFFLELANCSHPEEEHAGARRARKSGYTIDSHSYKVKFISWDDIWRMSDNLNSYTDLKLLDENVARILKSKFNGSTYARYGYSGASLKEFMENA